MSSRNVEEVETMALSHRVESIAASATMAAGDKARRLRSQGMEVFDLGPGQPDFDTPEHIREAGIRAIREGRTRYTATAGIPELRAAVADLYSLREGVPYRAEETIITCGGKQGLHHVLMALVNPGDEVVVPSPYWVSFPEMVRLAGGEPVVVETDEADRFELRADAIAAACTERTRVIVVNTPSNPTGAVVARAEMEALAQLALERGICLLLDECYARLVYEDVPHLTPLCVGPEAKSVTVLCGSCSKTYAMTGWRVGYVAGPRHLIDPMGRMQGHTTSNACSVSQHAALAALTGDQTPVHEMRAQFAERRARLLPRLQALPGVRCAEPRGAFYFFPNVEALLGEHLPTSTDLASHLIDTAHEVTVAGSAFGRDGYLRLSYAASMEVLEEALDRLDRAFGELLDRS